MLKTQSDHNYAAIGDNLGNYATLNWALRPEVNASSQAPVLPTRQSSKTHISDFTSLQYLDPDKVDLYLKHTPVQSAPPIKKVTNPWKPWTKVAIGLAVIGVIGIVMILAIILALLGTMSIPQFISSSRK